LGGLCISLSRTFPSSTKDGRVGILDRGMSFRLRGPE
jgi:hypothetical protein